MSVVFWKSKRVQGLTSFAVAVAPLVLPVFVPDAEFWQVLHRMGAISEGGLEWVHLLWILGSAAWAVYGFKVSRGKLVLK